MGDRHLLDGRCEQHEVPRDLAESLLLPRCVKCGQPLPEVARAIAEQAAREQRLQDKPVAGASWRGDTTTPPPPGASKEQVARWRRHQRMKQRGQADQIGYRGG